jgi:hypothetical protein
MRAVPVAMLLALALALTAGAANAQTPSGGHFCPRHSEEFDARELVGLQVGKARRRAERHDCSLRVVRRNGEWLVVTQDFRSDRINVAVRDRRVRRIVGVY